ncbi:glycosyltransferase family 4 protein [Faecalicatena sp. AGMB00832]|uniref:Glycosyltransferase family 4 protein n=1 Tax=Faecalicatena faecalis TaxID=2726362 RepID=A0ABS6DAT7_9FIRM|nr:glycosyltransferase [Faecalicatena faecalis]MBU3878752.1 glycosyltransferase family 4 protein [Faecalicatena faecalis]
MKILWICNVPIPLIAKHIGINTPNICGWLTGFANEINHDDSIELTISFPLLGTKEITKGKIERIAFYSFSQPKLLGFLPVEDQIHESNLMRKHIKIILESVKPDILHIFGTEYPHAKVAAELFDQPNKTVVHIQGLTSYYWMHFNSGIPYNQLKRFQLSNIARGNLIKQAEKMRKRGLFETEILTQVDHVIGRTDWDEACCTQTNPSVKYHFCNESLRDSFYYGSWTIEGCERYSIFMSQAATPIKGLHFMLRALPEIVKVYPETHLYIAGNNIVNRNSLYSKVKFSVFAAYIRDLIQKNNLENHVTFTGALNEEQMKEHFLQSNVFVSPSSIENSPNSLGEAMLLGIPCISSDVGGVKNLIEHGKEGYVYQGDAPYMLAYYVKKIFADSDTAYAMGRAAQKHARKTHDRKANLKRLLEIYKEISNVSNYEETIMQ